MAGERVLVVDDSLLYRDLLVNHVLIPHGYVPLTAGDGESGLHLALQEQPDLIIMDMQMPGMTGLQMLEALHARGSEIPVILMTLHGSEELAVHAFRMGIRDYVVKPFDIEEMLAAMDRALTESRLRRERDALLQTLEAERRQLAAVLTNTAEGVLLVENDEPERIILANHSVRRAFNLPDDVIGRPLTSVINDELLLDAFWRAKIGETTARVELPLPNGRTLNVNVTPIPGVGRVAIMHDITYLKELDRMKSEFVSAVSHDLRSPLTAIRGFVDLLPLAGALNEQQTYFLDKIRHSVEIVTAMITDLLDLGRIEAEVRMDVEECDIAAIIGKVVAGQACQAELKKQLLQVQIAPHLPAVSGNSLRLGQALANLLSNAIKYTPEGGRITVAAEVAEGQVMIRVEDNGIGIPQEDLPHIFDKFYRVKRPDTEEIVGTGLGLSIVKTIIEKHHGRVWVDSKLGEGSVFTVILPASSETRR
ncbi:MAG: ATP-binding protein [Anaerolineae bacterium]|nr:ATP-binding protein [Anaerolineae bacterium]